VEVAADRSGREQVTPTSPESSSRIRLNVTLYAATVVLACVAVFLGFVLNSRDVDVAFWNDDDSSATPDLGADVGRGVVTEVGEAPADVQERVADQLESATAMAVAMTNLDYREPDSAIKAVQGLASGDFLKQYNSATSDLKKLATEAKSTMTGKVVWSGLVSGDKDSATIIVATTGTVSNKETDFKERENNYRIQVELVLDEGKWLTRDLQFVT
jgi:Mce-associated membrane protein